MKEYQRNILSQNTKGTVLRGKQRNLSENNQQTPSSYYNIYNSDSNQMQALNHFNSLPESLSSEPLLVSSTPHHIMIQQQQQQQLQDRAFSFNPQFQNQTRPQQLPMNYKPQIVLNKGGTQLTLGGGNNVQNKSPNSFQHHNKTLNQEIMPVLNQVLSQIDQRNGHPKRNSINYINAQNINQFYSKDQAIPKHTIVDNEAFSATGDSYYYLNNIQKQPSVSFIHPVTGQIVDMRQQQNLKNHHSGINLPQKSSVSPSVFQQYTGNNNLQSFQKQANAIRNISPQNQYNIDGKSSVHHYNSQNINQLQQSNANRSHLNEIASRNSSLNHAVSNNDGLLFNQTLGSTSTMHLPAKTQKKYNQLRMYPQQNSNTIEETIGRISPRSHSPKVQQQQYQSPTQNQDNINMQTMNGILLPQNNAQYYKNYQMQQQQPGNEVLHTRNTNKALMELKEQRRAMKQLINTTSQKIIFGSPSSQQIPQNNQNIYGGHHYLGEGANSLYIEPQRLPVVKNRQKSNEQLWGTNQNLPQLKHGLVDSSPQSQENKRYSIQPQTMKYNTTKEFEPMFSSGNESRNGASSKPFNNYTNIKNQPIAQSSKGSELPLLKHFITKSQLNGIEGSNPNIQPFYEFVEENARKKQLKPLIKITPSNQGSVLDHQRSIAAVLSQSSLRNTPLQPGFRTNQNMENIQQPMNSEQNSFTSKDLQAEKVELLYKILDVLVQQDPSLIDQLIGNDSLSKAAHQLHLRNKSNFNIQESQEQIIDRQHSVDQISKQHVQYQQQQPLSHLIIPNDKSMIQSIINHNYQLNEQAARDYSQSLIKKNVLQPTIYQQQQISNSGTASSQTGSLKDKGKRNKIPIKFKVKKQFAEQLYVEDRQSTVDGDDSDFELPKQQQPQQQQRQLPMRRPYVNEDSVIYQEDIEQSSIDGRRNIIRTSQNQYIQPNFKYTTPPENEPTRIPIRSNAQSSILSGNTTQLQVAPPQYASKPNTMENEGNNNRRVLNNSTLKTKPPLTIDVELANKPLMKDEAIQFEDINGGNQQKLSNNNLPLPAQSQLQSSFNYSNNSYSGALREGAALHQGATHNTHGMRNQLKPETNNENSRNNYYISPSQIVNNQRPSLHEKNRVSRTNEHSIENSSPQGTLLDESRYKDMSPLTQNVLNDKYSLHQQKKPSSHIIENNQLSKTYNQGIRRSEIQQQSQYGNQEEKAPLVTLAQTKEIRGRISMKESNMSIQEFNNNQGPIRQQKTPDMQMTTQVTSNEYHQTQSSQKNKRSDEMSRGIDETEAVSIEKKHLSPRKKDSKVTITNLDDDTIIKEEEVKIPYAKSKFGNNKQSASKASNVSSFETKRGGIMSQKTYDDSFSDRVDILPNRQAPRSKISENSLKHPMLSGSRNEAGDSKRRLSTALAEVAEEHSEKTHHAKKPHRNDSSARHGIDQSLKSHDTLNQDKKRPRKIIVLKDYNPAEEEKVGPLTKLSSNAMNGSGNQPNHVGPINYSNRKSSNKLLFTQNILHKLKKKDSTVSPLLPPATVISDPLEEERKQQNLKELYNSQHFGHGHKDDNAKQEKNNKKQQSSLASSLVDPLLEPQLAAESQSKNSILNPSQELTRSQSRRKKDSKKPPMQQSTDQARINFEETQNQDDLKQKADLLPPPPSGKRRFVDIQLKLSGRKSPNANTRRSSIVTKK